MLSRGPVLAAAASLGSLGSGACGELQTSEVVLGSQCGPTLDFTAINQYHGQITAVQDREDAVVLLNGSCTGTLIAAARGPVVITAGHCVGLGDRSLVAFNVEDNPDGDPLVTNGTVIEQSNDPDYALIKLDQLPMATPPTLLTSQSSDLLAIIQHPRGRPKVVAEGTLLGSCSELMFYTDDTLVGSSGAGVLNRQGYLLGVHSGGDCAEDGSGSNVGSLASSIVQASPYLQPADIADR